MTSLAELFIKQEEHFRSEVSPAPSGFARPGIALDNRDIIQTVPSLLLSYPQIHSVPF